MGALVRFVAYASGASKECLEIHHSIDLEFLKYSSRSNHRYPVLNS